MAKVEERILKAVREKQRVAYKFFSNFPCHGFLDTAII